MSFRDRSSVAILAVLTGLFAVVGPAWASQDPPSTPPPSATAATEAMVALADGRQLHLRCSGTGGPTVILDAGLGLDSSVWMRVQPGLAAITRTCAYDRAGYGRSDPGPMPRDTENRTSDLIGLLDATVEDDPFILVAHSAAELTARLAAEQRPDMIAGLVLVDPGVPVEILKAVGPAWGAAYETGQAAAFTCIRATAAGEMRPGNAIYAECGSPPTEGRLASRTVAAAVLSESETEPMGSPGGAGLGNLRLIVLTAQDKFGTNEGAGPTETEALRQAWLEGGAAIAGMSTRGEQRVIPNASHVIQFEQPQAVIDAVGDVVTAVRADGPARVLP